ncbi:MAG: hypothetical protein Kow0062_27110 [Acidobacteriota bacterium]
MSAIARRIHGTIGGAGRPVAAALVAVALLGVGPAWAGTMSLAWDPVSDSDLAGYRVYYGTAPTQLDQQKDAGLATSTTLSGLANCTMWYAVVRAYDQGGLESPLDPTTIKGWPRPVVQTVVPGEIEQGQTVTFTVSGTNFDPGDPLDPGHPAADVELSHGGLVVESVQVNACGELLVTVRALASAAPGTSDLTVLNPDLTFGDPGPHPKVFGTLADAIRVTSSGPGDQTPPAVAGTSPAAGAVDVAPSVRPTVTFSEAVDPATVTPQTVQLLDAKGAVVPQAAGWPTTSGAVVTIRPQSALADGASYRIFVRGGTSGVRDLAGNPLAADWRQDPPFTVASGGPQGGGSGPSVDSASPAPGARDVALTLDTVTLGFDRDMSRLQQVMDQAELRERFYVTGPRGRLAQTAGSPSFADAGRTVVITLARPLEAGAAHVSHADLSGPALRDRLEQAGLGDLWMSAPYASAPWFAETAVDRIDYQSSSGGQQGTLTMPDGNAVPDGNSGVPTEPEFEVRFAYPLSPESVDQAGITVARVVNQRAARLLTRLRSGLGGKRNADVPWRRDDLADEVRQSMLGLDEIVDDDPRTQVVPYGGRPVPIDKPFLRDANRTLVIRPSEPLEPGRMYEIRIEGGVGGVLLVTADGPTSIAQPPVIVVPFYTEISAAAQSLSLGVAE